jgi:hypothetical protein
MTGALKRNLLIAGSEALCLIVLALSVGAIRPSKHVLGLRPGQFTGYRGPAVERRFQKNPPRLPLGKSLSNLGELPNSIPMQFRVRLQEAQDLSSREDPLKSSLG